MNKRLITALFFIIVIVGLVFFALSKTGIDDANPQPVTIELDDNFET
ncbi:hypothetical protein [Robiginitomaculum antarcticum]|nr:hypothetical protein [Robiginitomaculum antarcticum]